MMLKPEVVAQLERVLSSVEQLLPKACKPVELVDLFRCQLAPSFLFRFSRAGQGDRHHDP